MYLLVVAAGAMLSADTVAEIVEMVQDDVFIEQIEITPPDPMAIAFLRSSTDDIENICLEYLYEYPNIDTPMHRTGRSDARTQYKTVSKTVEYLSRQKSIFLKSGAQYGAPIGLKINFTIMCLYTRQIMPTKARKNIICYKIVKRYPHRTGEKKYKTPCTKISIKCFSMYTAENLSPDGQNNRIKVATNTTHIRLTKIADLHKYHAHPMALSMNLVVYTVSYGYIHCCTTIDACKEWIHRNHNLFPHNKKAAFHWGIIKCIIPKGTLYYKSYDGTQICAKTLKTKEIVLKG